MNGMERGKIYMCSLSKAWKRSSVLLHGFEGRDEKSQASVSKFRELDSAATA